MLLERRSRKGLARPITQVSPFYTGMKTMHRRQEGFTLVELLVVLGLTSILLTLGAFAIRHFWFVRSLSGAEDQVATQLRRQQQRVTAASNPFVYGAHFEEGSTDWELIRFDPKGAGSGDDECSVQGTRGFDLTVEVSGVDFDETQAPEQATACVADLGGAADEYAFFFARGNATQGSVTVTQPQLGRSRTVTVTDITGRVVKQ
jgi:prepilin-type N-terminal cleavage/methylation domain-containing protein